MTRTTGQLLSSLALVALPLALACREPAGTSDASVDAMHVEDAAVELDAGPGPDAPRAPDAGPPEDLEGAIAYWAEAGSLAGVAALAADDDTRLVVTTGMATDTTEVDEHTLFNVASLSKTFTCALVLSLVEQGLLELDAPLSEILPDVPIVHPRFPDAPITTRMLLSHTSGLVDDFLFLGEYTNTGMDDPSVGFEAFTRAYVEVEAHWGAEPGTRHDYCNAGYGLLGLVIERVSGRDLRDLTRERLGPAGLDGAGWFFADIDTSRLATPYAKSGRRYAALPHHGFAFYPASSMMISVSGVERWLRLHVEDGTIDGMRILDASSVEETRRIQFPDADGSQGLTWYHQRTGGERFWGHSGSSYGTSAQMRYRPESRRLLVVLSNSDAYIRNRAGLTEGADAIDAILERLDHELDVR
jgi:CubicO group peptidase (beta-lactamase class C family)